MTPPIEREVMATHSQPEQLSVRWNAECELTRGSTVFSAVVASPCAERMMFSGVRLEALTRPLVTLVVVNLALFLGPLFFGL